MLLTHPFPSPSSYITSVLLVHVQPRASGRGGGRRGGSRGRGGAGRGPRGRRGGGYGRGGHGRRGGGSSRPSSDEVAPHHAAMIRSLNTPEDIEKWRAERRKRYPTAANIQKKHEADAARRERGELLPAVPAPRNGRGGARAGGRRGGRGGPERGRGRASGKWEQLGDGRGGFGRRGNDGAAAAATALAASSPAAAAVDPVVTSSSGAASALADVSTEARPQRHPGAPPPGVEGRPVASGMHPLPLAPPPGIVVAPPQAVAAIAPGGRAHPHWAAPPAAPADADAATRLAAGAVAPPMEEGELREEVSATCEGAARADGHHLGSTGAGATPSEHVYAGRARNGRGRGRGRGRGGRGRGRGRGRKGAGRGGRQQLGKGLAQTPRRRPTLLQKLLANERRQERSVVLQVSGDASRARAVWAASTSLGFVLTHVCISITRSAAVIWRLAAVSVPGEVRLSAGPCRWLQTGNRYGAACLPSVCGCAHKACVRVRAWLPACLPALRCRLWGRGMRLSLRAKVRVLPRAADRKLGRLRLGLPGRRPRGFGTPGCRGGLRCGHGNG